MYPIFLCSCTLDFRKHKIIHSQDKSCKCSVEISIADSIVRYQSSTLDLRDKMESI